MKVIILAGGLPSTISDEKNGIPKPMAEIGGRPILWHIMKLYSYYGYNEFIICGGYRVEMIKDYFQNFYIYQSDITIDLQTNEITIHRKKTEDWRVTVIDTGLESSTAERIRQVESYIDTDDFIVTYGDCISNLEVPNPVSIHLNHKPLATMVVAKPTGRHSVLSIDEESGLLNRVDTNGGDAWVNASCYVFSRRIFSELGKGELNEQFMEKVAAKEQILTYKHHGFWSPVETRRDSYALECMWEAQKAPWKVWRD